MADTRRPILREERTLVEAVDGTLPSPRNEPSTAHAVALEGRSHYLNVDDACIGCQSIWTVSTCVQIDAAANS